MNNVDEQRNEQARENEQGLSLDEVVATQPELGPSIPDGGFGWAVFLGTLFFQALIPCMTINFGIFVAFSKLENGTAADKNIALWSEKILYVPLFFSISRIFFDSFARRLTFNTNSPRLIAVIGTCLTCAGLLFMWMGMTGNKDYWLFAPAGFISGLGASILLVQCETLLAQYFRLKLPILKQISQFVAFLGFLVSPMVLGSHIISTNLTQVLLWYQAIILQGLVVGLLFRKPLYLKSKGRTKPYLSVLSNPDDEEDILSKNSRELQIKRQTSSESHMSKIALPQPSTSSSSSTKQQEWIQINKNAEDGERNKPKKWESFDQEDEEDIKYAKLSEWEVFDEDEDKKHKVPKPEDWERFEDDGPPSPRIVNDLSLAEETNTQRKNKAPMPLFADFPVNNNNTYAYDDEIVPDATNSNVFMPTTVNNNTFRRHLDVLKEPTFYKSLFMMIANTYSAFVFYALFPSYLYIEADSVNIRHMSQLVGWLTLVNLIYLCSMYWIPVSKVKRPICLWIFYWVGSVGYFMIADFTNEYILLIGSVQIVLSIGALDHICKPLLKIPVKGANDQEHMWLTIFSSISLLLFVCIDVSFQTCFRLVAILHFFSGSLWLANFAYKLIRRRYS